MLKIIILAVDVLDENYGPVEREICRVHTLTNRLSEEQREISA